MSAPSMSFVFRGWIGVTIGIAALYACSLRIAAQTPATGGVGCPGEYTIGPEDILDIAVWNNNEISRTVPVRPDGKISLPLLNDVQAAGLTPMQLRESLSTLLKTYMSVTSVSVLVREIHSVKATVIGQVKTPGRYELKDRATVLDVLAMAGGLNEYAARSRIVVLRQQPAGTQQMPFPYDKLTAKDGSRSASKTGAPQNFCVQPGDVVLVP